MRTLRRSRVVYWRLLATWSPLSLEPSWRVTGGDSVSVGEVSCVSSESGVLGVDFIADFLGVTVATAGAAAALPETKAVRVDCLAAFLIAVRL